MACLVSDPRADRLHGDPRAAPLHTAIAGELREIRDRLERLAGALIADPHVATAHLQQLQSFDYLIQHANECAGLLERFADGQEPLSAVGDVRLGEVQDRLRAALKGY